MDQGLVFANMATGTPLASTIEPNIKAGIREDG
jgi:hypothetical protein